MPPYLLFSIYLISHNFSQSYKQYITNFIYRGLNMDLKDYTLVELRQLAKERGVKNVSKLKKEELLNF